MQHRRSNYDVTDQVKLSDPVCVYEEIRATLDEFCPNKLFVPMHQAFHDFENLYRGRLEGFRACDVPYHDMQHVLDVTLATARMISGYEKSSRKSERLGAERLIMGVLLALYHDVGYIRREDDDQTMNGAEYTKSHITRGANYLAEYLPTIGLERYVPVVQQLIHYTGYEMAIDDIKVDDDKDRILGYLIGSADLLAQMADRCYLEKCRDRLYPEFVLGGMTKLQKDDGSEEVLYGSPEELLQKTPQFYEYMVRARLDEKFGKVSDCIENYFGGQNLYQEEIERNLRHLHSIIEEGNFNRLRRNLPETPEAKAFEETTESILTH